VDEPVVVCRDGINTLITSRKPDDLAAFCRELTSVFAEAQLMEVGSGAR
jgi:protease I